MSTPISKNKSLFWLGVLFCLIAVGVRIPFILHHPEGFHRGRQHLDLLLSRGIYYQYFVNPQHEEEKLKKETAIEAAKVQEVLEPRILQTLVAFTYVLVGGEHIWASRLVSLAIWLLGALFLYRLAKRWFSESSSWVAVAIYLFYPYGLLMGVSFQPDVPMMVTSIAALLCFDRFFETPESRPRLIAAGVVSLLAVLIKPLCLIPLFCIFFASLWSQRGLLRAFFSSTFLIFSLLILFPAISYYYLKIFLREQLNWQFYASVIPYYLVTREFWYGWKALFGLVIGFTPAFLTVIGSFLVPHPRGRVMLVGYIVGYLFFGITFTYQMHTHEYYQLILIPWVSLGIAGLFERFQIFAFLKRGAIYRISFFIFLGFVVWKAVLKTEYIVWSYQFSQWNEVMDQIQRIRVKIPYNNRIIYLTSLYAEGKMLQYYGWLAGFEWPAQEQINLEKRKTDYNPPAEKRFQSYIRGGPRDFFVVTDKNELALQSDLRTFLNRSFPVYASDVDYVIYDLRKTTKHE